MARNTTRQGANFELKVMHHLEGYGYECLRSSGSRGKVDVVAVGPETRAQWRSLLFIQCKITNPVIPPAERVGLMNIALRGGGTPLVAHWAKDGTTGPKIVHYRLLIGPGPKDWVHWHPEEVHP